MIQSGAFTILILSIISMTEAFALSFPKGFHNAGSIRWSKHLLSDPTLNYRTEGDEMTLPEEDFVPGSFSVDQMQSHRLRNINMPLYRDPQAITLAAKRALNGLPVISKRIHTCAFMRRLGLPIGLCFKGSRVRVSQPPLVKEEVSPEQDVYAYLQQQWPVQGMLGGSVGK